jgi:hypothetical protein
MKKNTEKADKEKLSKSVDELTEENQRHFLGVLEALAFAQSDQDKSKPRREGELPVYPV